MSIDAGSKNAFEFVHEESPNPTEKIHCSIQNCLTDPSSAVSMNMTCLVLMILAFCFATPILNGILPLSSSLLK